MFFRYILKVFIGLFRILKLHNSDTVKFLLFCKRSKRYEKFFGKCSDDVSIFRNGK